MSQNTTGDALGVRLPNDGPTPGPESNQHERNTQMTTETTETATTEPRSSEPAAPTTDHETTETGSTAEKRYRLQLREAEAERDSLRTVVESMRRQDAERLAGDRLASAKLLWTLGQGPADVLTDDGTGVDPDKVSALCDAVLTEYGQGVAKRARGGYAPLEGRSPRNRPGGPQTKGLDSAFSPDGWGE
jgi:hypothetical protein